jgi:hypothetical protein
MLMPMTGRSPDDLRDSLAAAAALVDRPHLRIGRVPEEALWLLAHDRLAAPHRYAGATSESGLARQSSAALAETGYYVSRTAASDHLVIDGGPHGYQNGGHAHADALSLTWSVRGVPLLIDPGTACYTTDRLIRNRFRSTALHNTLTLDDRPQSVPAGPFHWSHTADSRVTRWRTNRAFDYFEGVHDGYRPIAHRRCVLALHDDLLIVADLMDGPGTHTAACHWHVDPRWTAEIHGRGATFRLRGRRIGLVVPEGQITPFSGDSTSGLGWHSPIYGRVERATTLRITRSAPTPFWMASVFDLRAENPVVDVHWLAVWSKAGALERAAALCISRAASTDYLLIAEPVAAAAASPAAGRVTWRLGNLETDARMLFYRATAERRVSRLALVDGSIVRVAGSRGFLLDLHHVAPDYSADFRIADHGRSQGRRPEDPSCAASPVS